MKVAIRKALKQDMPGVLNLIRELAIFEKEPDAVEVTVPELEAAGFGPQPSFTCFVAETGGILVGMALVYFRFSTWKGNTVHLEDLIVKESMRGKGIGSLLYRKVMEYAAQQKIKRVNWEVLAWNTPAIEFYEKTGARVLHDWIRVEFSKNDLDNFLEA